MDRSRKQAGKYRGAFQNGKMHGSGLYMWANGDKYDGEWADGEMNGKGVKTKADGTVIHSGRWSSHKPTGPSAGIRPPAPASYAPGGVSAASNPASGASYAPGGVSAIRPPAPASYAPGGVSAASNPASGASYAPGGVSAGASTSSLVRPRILPCQLPSMLCRRALSFGKK